MGRHLLKYICANLIHMNKKQVKEFSKEFKSLNSQIQSLLIKYCMDKNLRSVARWAADLIDQPGTIKRYYIDTQIVKNMFSVGEDTRLFRELECEVSTHVGMKG